MYSFPYAIIILLLAGLPLIKYTTNSFNFCVSADADLVIPGNKFMSTVHCVFVRGQGGQALLKDTSTNGTLLNGSRLERNAEVIFYACSFNHSILLTS